jgi:hypothetical protein
VIQVGDEGRQTLHLDYALLAIREPKQQIAALLGDRCSGPFAADQPDFGEICHRIEVGGQLRNVLCEIGDDVTHECWV